VGKMADVRSLLRQQQASRRITHPHAQYSDSGKLACSLCHEPVKTEALWDNHVRNPTHRSKLQALREAQARDAKQDGTHAGGKRKHTSSDDEMEIEEEVVRKKRSKNDIAPITTRDIGLGLIGLDNEGEKELKEQTLTPPPLSRRTSTTPVHGMEMRIPSRPATPMAPRDGSSSSTPNTASFARTPSLSGPATATSLASAPARTAQGDEIDEDEWAAFEADIVATDTAPTYSADAVISAPAMTTEELAAKQAEEAAEQRTAADIEVEDEREEAMRAIEDEFAEMEELEQRVQRLKEKREALRAQAPTSVGGADGPPKDSGSVNLGKENINSVASGVEDDEGEDDEDYDDDWAWGGFRVKGTA